MEMSNRQQIGTHFKKENIFLATITLGSQETQDLLDASGKAPDSIAFFCKNGFLSIEEPDLFYKDENGYTRFVEEGPETFVGDNSDGKGFIRNIVPIWEYFSEEQVFETMLNNEFMAICCSTVEPLNKYNHDYNDV